MTNAELASSKGNVCIHAAAIAKIAGYAATMSYGVVGMAYRSKTDTVPSTITFIPSLGTKSR